MRQRVVWEADGVESSVALDLTEEYAFIVNGKSDGSALGDAPTQVMSGLLGALVHPNPRRALVIGLGTGSTAGWLAKVPSIERVDVVELEPAIVHVARGLLRRSTRTCCSNPKVHLMIGDGRELLLTTGESLRPDLLRALEPLPGRRRQPVQPGLLPGGDGSGCAPAASSSSGSRATRSTPRWCAPPTRRWARSSRPIESWQVHSRRPAADGEPPARGARPRPRPLAGRDRALPHRASTASGGSRGSRGSTPPTWPRRPSPARCARPRGTPSTPTTIRSWSSASPGTWAASGCSSSRTSPAWRRRRGEDAAAADPRRAARLVAGRRDAGGARRLLGAGRSAIPIRGESRGARLRIAARNAWLRRSLARVLHELVRAAGAAAEPRRPAAGRRVPGGAGRSADAGVRGPARRRPADRDRPRAGPLARPLGPARRGQRAPPRRPRRLPPGPHGLPAADGPHPAAGHQPRRRPIRALAPRLYAALGQPFSARMFEHERLLSRVWLARGAESPALCAQAIAPLEPHVPWDGAVPRLPLAVLPPPGRIRSAPRAARDLEALPGERAAAAGGPPPALALTPPARSHTLGSAPPLPGRRGRVFIVPMESSVDSIRTIGVVGAGTMGHGIAQVAAQSGYEVVLVDAAPAALERGRTQVGKGLERLVAKGKLTAEDRDQALAAADHRRRPRRPRARRPGGRGGGRAAGGQAEGARRARPRLPAGDDPRHQHQLDLDHQARRRHRAAGEGDRHALHEPRAGDAAHRGHPRPRHQPGDLRRRRGGLAADGQDPGRGPRRPRLRLQPGADADDQRGDLLPPRGGREAGGDRRGYEAGDEPSDGTPGARRPDRPRRLPRHPARPAAGVRRSQVPPLPAAGQDGRRRPPGPQVGARVLRLSAR